MTGHRSLTGEISALRWWHSIDLGDGVVTPGYKSPELLETELAALRLPDLAGRSVLDIAAWDGYFSFAAERLGAARVWRAYPEFVRAATGMAIGGVAPIGHERRIRTLVDVDLARHPVVWAAGGHPHTVFPTSYDELLRITGGEPAVVGA